MIRINLLAAERESKKKKATFQSGQKVTIACSLVLVLTGTVIGWRFMAISRESRKLDEDIAKAQTEATRLHAVIQQVQQFEQQKAQLTSRKLDEPKYAGLTEMYAKESELDRLAIERDLAKKVYQDVANSYESARLLVAARSSALQILTRAIPPEKPESQKFVRNILIGTLSGFLLSSLLVLVRESLS